MSVSTADVVPTITLGTPGSPQAGTTRRTGGSVDQRASGPPAESARVESNGNTSIAGLDPYAVAMEANEKASELGVSIRFHVASATGELVIEVRDRETGELIRRLPPESLRERLSRTSGLDGMITGVEG